MEAAVQLARRMWTMFEPVHAVTYFAPEARTAFDRAGLRGFWRGYFAGRAAPLGAVTAGPVTASFYNFAPQMVRRAVPAVWELITPARVLQVRAEGAVAALRRVLSGPDGAAEWVPAAADLLTTAVADLDCAGRVLAAANQELPAPDEPVARLWHAATLLREHRGDGHFAALLAADIDGCEALVLRADELPREQLQPLRGWTDEEWESAAARLAGRGLVDGDGAVTLDGATLRAAIEHTTDAAAARPWSRLGPAFADKLAAVLAPISYACAAELPFPNPVGVPDPARAAAAAGDGRRRDQGSL
jgi:hypothetical protein